MLYRNYATTEEVDKAYNVESFTEGFKDYIKRYGAESARVRETFAVEERRYGEMLDERVHLLRPADAGAKKPMVVLVHGGGWRIGQAEEYEFPALGLSRHAALAIINYTLAPYATFSEMVHQVRSAIAWAYRHADEFGGDPDRLYVVGHSAGAHLSVMAALTDWQGTYGLPADTIKGVAAVSGIYDMRPLRYTAWLAAALQLTGRDLVEISPMLVDLPASAPPILFAYGDEELPEFKRQSEDFHARWRAAGLPGDIAAQKDKNHFSILLDLLDERMPLTRSIIDLLG